MASDGGIGVKLRAEGEAEFKKALSDLNAQFKLIKSQLNLVSSEYDQNDKSAQAVAARSKVLTEQMEAQRSKIELLEKALASATTAYGEGDKRTLAYATQLTKMETVRNPNDFGDFIRSLNVYGFKVVKPESLVLAIVN